MQEYLVFIRSDLFTNTQVFVSDMDLLCLWFPGNAIHIYYFNPLSVEPREVSIFNFDPQKSE